MNIIMISKDTKILDSNTAVFLRMVRYANMFDKLSIVVCGSATNNNFSKTEKLDVINSTSRFRALSFIKAFFITFFLSRRVSQGAWITAQDPFEVGIIAYLVARLTKKNLQLQLHTDCFNHFYRRHSILNRMRSHIAKWLISKVDVLRVVSEHIKATIADLNIIDLKKVVVLPVYVDVANFIKKPIMYNLKEKFPQFKKTVLVVARLESEKNLELTLHSFAKVLRICPDTGLIVAGEGSKLKWLKQLVEHLKISQNVVFLGWVSDTASLYKTADVLLITSFYEGYGMNMVEASVCGIPIVSTSVGIAEEVGAHIVPYDAGCIARDIINLLQNPSPSKTHYSLMTEDEYLKKFKQTFQYA